jgi:hypothetical protein
VLAAYLDAARSGVALDAYLDRTAFSGFVFETAEPRPDDVAGFAAHLESYRDGLAAERAAVESIALKGAAR